MRHKAPLILGAGPAGCAAAIVLGKAGIGPRLLDRDREAQDALCGGFLSWRTIEQLRVLGIDVAVLGARAVNHLSLFARGSQTRIALPAPACGLSRHALDNAMRRQAVQDGAELVVDTVRHIEGTKAVGQVDVWEGNGLFLASGKHDVRGAVRPRDASDPTLGFRVRLKASDHLEKLVADSIELHLFRNGYAGVVLQEDGSANICLAVRKSLLTKADGKPEKLLEMLSASAPEFGERLGNGWHSETIDTIAAIPYGFVARDTQSGLFRLGDQAAVIPSLAGEGIAIALASGSAAARHWLKNGPEGARIYQRDFARKAASSVRAAAWARTVAERRWAQSIALPLLGRFPGLARLLLDRTRIS